MSVFRYLEHPSISSRMKNDIAHVKIELSNIKELTGKDVTSSTAQVLNLPALWIEFMTLHLAEIERHGKTWLNARLKEAETKYDAHMKSLKVHQAKLAKSEKQTGAAKLQYDNARKAKNQKLEVDLKQKDVVVADARKKRRRCPKSSQGHRGRN